VGCESVSGAGSASDGALSSADRAQGDRIEQLHRRQQHTDAAARAERSGNRGRIRRSGRGQSRGAVISLSV